MFANMKQKITMGVTMFALHELDENEQKRCWCVENVEELPSFLQTDHIKKLFHQKKSAYWKEGNLFYMLECVLPKTPLYIMGGGTIALFLAQMAQMCDFEVHVFDDRKEFANPSRFPWAKEVVCMSFDELFSSYRFQKDAYYVLVTRGHLKDEQCLKKVLQLSYSYVGMIGSKRKNQIIREHLLKDGIEKGKLDEVHAPIGLEIQSDTPAEIAVSILAELIQERAQLRPQSTAEEIWKSIEKDCILATILYHDGSTPREMGSKMLVFKDGHFEGSVGGGSLEYAVQKQAKLLFQRNSSSLVMHFSLSNEDAAKEGMVCGGNASVLLEKIDVLW